MCDEEKKETNTIFIVIAIKKKYCDNYQNFENIDNYQNIENIVKITSLNSVWFKPWTETHHLKTLSLAFG